MRKRERELVALLSLSCWCFVIVVWLFLSVPWVCLQFVIVIFTNHTHLLFRGVIHVNSDDFGDSARRVLILALSPCYILIYMF